MAGHQGMSHGMPMNVPNQISGPGVPSGMPMGGQPMPGQQMPMSQPQKMIPSPQVQQQQQQQPPQQPSQQQPHPQPSPHPDHSSIEKMKALVPHLKKALSNVMRLAGESLRRDDIYPSSGSAPPTQTVEKALEEFFAICDQLEMQLGIALEGFNQVIQHKKYLNTECIKYSFPPGQSPDLAQTYNAYSTVIRSQVALASSLHDALINCADQISGIPTMPTSAGSGTTPSKFAQSGTAQPGTQFAAGGLAAPPPSTSVSAPTATT